MKKKKTQNWEWKCGANVQRSLAIVSRFTASCVCVCVASANVFYIINSFHYNKCGRLQVSSFRKHIQTHSFVQLIVVDCFVSFCLAATLLPPNSICNYIFSVLSIFANVGLLDEKKSTINIPKVCVCVKSGMHLMISYSCVVCGRFILWTLKNINIEKAKFNVCSCSVCARATHTDTTLIDIDAYLFRK